jgi:hypothetical protein
MFNKAMAGAELATHSLHITQFRAHSLHITQFRETSLNQPAQGSIKMAALEGLPVL